MKYKLTINRDMQEVYNKLIEDGYLPDEAKRKIESDLKELAEKINWYADNIFWGNYIEVVKVEEIDGKEN